MTCFLAAHSTKSSANFCSLKSNDRQRSFAFGGVESTQGSEISCFFILVPLAHQLYTCCSSQCSPSLAPDVQKLTGSRTVTVQHQYYFKTQVLLSISPDIDFMIEDTFSTLLAINRPIFSFLHECTASIKLIFKNDTLQ